MEELARGAKLLEDSEEREEGWVGEDEKAEGEGGEIEKDCESRARGASCQVEERGQGA